LNKILKFVWDEFIYGGHLFALNAVSIVLMCTILFDFQSRWDFIIVIYLIFYSIYLNDHFKGAEKDFLTNAQRAKHLKNRKKAPLVIFGSVLISGIILFYFNNFYNLIFGFIILILGLFYGACFKRITRKILGFKNLFVSLVWAIIPIFLFFYYSYSFTSAMVLISIFIFLRMLIIQILFDIRDIDSDKRERLLTIPIVLGRGGAINILKLINILIMFLMICGLYFNIISESLFILILIIFYSFYYIRKIENLLNKNNNLYFLFATIEPIVWFFLVLFDKTLLCC